MSANPIAPHTADERSDRRARRIRYFSSCSRTALESVTLSRLNKASNLRKELRTTIDEWVEAEVEARLAVEARMLRSAPLTPLPLAQVEQLPLNFEPPSHSRRAPPGKVLPLVAAKESRTLP
jgi:hypothetical protein